MIHNNQDYSIVYLIYVFEACAKIIKSVVRWQLVFHVQYFRVHDDIIKLNKNVYIHVYISELNIILPIVTFIIKINIYFFPFWVQEKIR